MNEQKNNGRGIFYGVIGVATLVVAIIGATFAYFTATAGNNVISGNMASINLSLDVTKVTTVDETLGGMIPMSNNMVEAAVESDTNKVCVDDNGNAVCQIYKITITNDSSAGQFVDGYVALLGGSGIEPTDIKEVSGFSYVANALYNTDLKTANKGTTMRWAQVFQDTSGKFTGGNETDYTLDGTQKLGANSGEEMAVDFVANTPGVDESAEDDKFTHNAVNIRNANVLVSENSARGVLKPVEILGNSYNVIGMNYIRTSNHSWNLEGKAESYDRTNDVTSALVYNQNLTPDTDATNSKAEYYIVVWLSETGTNQTAGAAVGGDGGYVNPAALNFFKGNVTFVSAQGSEVSATFSSYARVESDQVKSDDE